MGDRSHATMLYNTGVEAANNKQYPGNASHAYQSFVSACYADPTWWMPFYQTGNNNSDLDHLPAAIACWRRAIEAGIDPADEAKVYSNLAWRLHTVGKTDEAWEYAVKATETDPTLAYGWLNLALLCGSRDQSAEAVKYAQKAFDLLPTDPIMEMALSFALLFNRQFAEGLKHFECRFKYKLHNFLSYPYPRWNGEPDKTIFLVADQGLGDTLSYARFVEAASKRARYIHACVQPSLMRLFQHAFAHLPNVNLLPLPSHFPAADHWSTFVSLPYALGLTDEQIRNAPNIAVPVFSLPKNWKVPDRKLHIGIAWRGSQLNDINMHRSIPVTRFLDLYKVPGIQLYSLQVDDSRNQMHDQGCAALIKDLSGYVSDVTDTVSLLKELDLVVTCESALGHICVAAGKEAWVPYSYGGRDYRLGLTGEDQLWSKHRIFRQGIDQDWEPVFENIVEALRERVGA